MFRYVMLSNWRNLSGKIAFQYHQVISSFTNIKFKFNKILLKNSKKKKKKIVHWSMKCGHLKMQPSVWSGVKFACGIHRLSKSNNNNIYQFLFLSWVFCIVVVVVVVNCVSYSSPWRIVAWFRYDARSIEVKAV